MMPSVKRSRFEAELAKDLQSLHIQALSNAIATLGALACPSLLFALDACYERARNLLDMCERRNGSSLIHINVLQAYILLGLYESRRPDFALAWITIGRALRLGQIMCLDKGQPQSFTEGHVGVFTPLPPTFDPTEIEERHRTLWHLYILDGLASMRTCSAPALDRRQVSQNNRHHHAAIV